MGQVVNCVCHVDDSLVREWVQKARAVAMSKGYSIAPSPAAASGVPLEVGMIEQFCRDLNDAHNEILRLQGVQPEDYSKYDWPEWSAPANSIRWAERVLGKPLSKTSLRSSPLPAEAQEPWQFAREQFIEAARRIEEQCISHSIADMLRDAARHAPSDTKGR
jgi:hypothetical protein